MSIFGWSECRDNESSDPDVDSVVNGDKVVEGWLEYGSNADNSSSFICDIDRLYCDIVVSCCRVKASVLARL